VGIRLEFRRRCRLALSLPISSCAYAFHTSFSTVPFPCFHILMCTRFSCLLSPTLSLAVRSYSSPTPLRCVCLTRYVTANTFATPLLVATAHPPFLHVPLCCTLSVLLVLSFLERSPRCGSHVACRWHGRCRPRRARRIALRPVLSPTQPLALIKSGRALPPLRSRRCCGFVLHSKECRAR